MEIWIKSILISAAIASVVGFVLWVITFKFPEEKVSEEARKKLENTDLSTPEGILNFLKTRDEWSHIFDIPSAYYTVGKEPDKLIYINQPEELPEIGEENTRYKLYYIGQYSFDPVYVIWIGDRYWRYHVSPDFDLLFELERVRMFMAKLQEYKEKNKHKELWRKPKRVHKRRERRCI